MGDDGVGGFEWKPSDILENEFPNEISPDTSMEEAQRFAMRGTNALMVSQPGRPGDGSNTHDYSDYFVVNIQSSKRYYRQPDEDSQEDGRREGWESERRKWVLGVAIGVPVGTLLLTALAWFVGFRAGKGRAVRRGGKGI